MSLRWLAAMLIPADVAPHPNFGATQKLAPEAFAALLVQSRWYDFTRYLDEPGMLERKDSQVPLSIRRSLTVETAGRGADELAVLAGEQFLDRAPRAVCAVMAAIALSELDRHDDAIEALDSAAADTSPTATDDRVLLAFLAIQRAMRLREIGGNAREDAQRALSYLDGVKSSGATTFALRAGARRRSAQTVSALIDELWRCARENSLAVETNVNFGAWRDLAQQAEPRERLISGQHALAGYAYLSEELFRRHLDTNERVFSTSDAVDGGLYEAYLHFEISGSIPASPVWRARLGILRFIRRSWAEMSDEQTEGLRLLRHADDLKRVDQAVRYLRSEGSLESLRRDAEVVVHRRLAPERLRMVDLAVLGGGAELLSSEQAAIALDAVVAAIETHMPAPSRRNDMLSIRLERGWRTAAALAHTANQIDDFAASLLQSLEEGHEEPDELLLSGYVRVAAGIPWAELSESVADAWRSFISGDGLVQRSLARTVGRDLGLPPETQDEPSLADVASAISATTWEGGALDQDFAERASRELAATMNSIVDAAATGAHTMRAYNPAELAVALIAYAGREELWDPLAALLAEPSVSRTDKGAALSLLSRTTPPIPPTASRVLADSVGALLQTSQVDPLEPTSGPPFGPALRFLVAYNMVSQERVVAELTPLMASTDPSARAEASRVVGALAQHRQPYAWARPMVIYLSHDPAAKCRAEAGRCLAQVDPGEHGSVVQQRLLELLADDGLLVPVFVLRGLGGSSRPIRDDVLAAVSRMAESHLAVSVRQLAGEVVATKALAPAR